MVRCSCRSERIVESLRILCWLRMRKSGWCFEVCRLVRSRVWVVVVGVSFIRSVGEARGVVGCGLALV